MPSVEYVDFQMNSKGFLTVSTCHVKDLLVYCRQCHAKLLLVHVSFTVLDYAQ